MFYIGLIIYPLNVYKMIVFTVIVLMIFIRWPKYTKIITMDGCHPYL